MRLSQPVDKVPKGCIRAENSNWICRLGPALGANAQLGTHCFCFSSYRTISNKSCGDPYIEQIEDGVNRYSKAHKISRGEAIRRLVEHALADLKP
jgi:hypothetical protein